MKRYILLSAVLLATLVMWGCDSTDDSTATDGDGIVDGDAEVDDATSDGDTVDGDNEFDEAATDGDTTDADGSDADVSDGDVSDGDDDCEVVYTDGLFAGLCRCDMDIVRYPCVLDMEFEETSITGGFHIGPQHVLATEEIDIENDWVLFKYNYAVQGEIFPSGLFLYNYKLKQAIQLNWSDKGSDWVSIHSNLATWVESEKRNQGTPTSRSLWTMRIDDLNPIKSVDTDSMKRYVTAFNNRVVWIDQRVNDEDLAKNLFLLEANEDPQKLNSISNNVTYVDLSDSWLVYAAGLSTLVTINLNTKEESVLADLPAWSSDMAIWGSKLYSSDFVGSPPSGYICGASIREYDLETKEKNTLLQSEGLSDFLVQDIWEDWLLYITCDEDNGKDLEYKHCCIEGGHGDVHLRYLPTGETWNLSNHSGDQRGAKMWGPLVVWIDARVCESCTDLHGIDLCKHPELKTRFTECAEREK